MKVKKNSPICAQNVSGSDPSSTTSTSDGAKPTAGATTELAMTSAHDRSSPELPRPFQANTLDLPSRLVEVFPPSSASTEQSPELSADASETTVHKTETHASDHFNRPYGDTNRDAEM